MIALRRGSWYNNQGWPRLVVAGKDFPAICGRCYGRDRGVSTSMKVGSMTGRSDGSHGLAVRGTQPCKGSGVLGIRDRAREARVEEISLAGGDERTGGA